MFSTSNFNLYGQHFWVTALLRYFHTIQFTHLQVQNSVPFGIFTGLCSHYPKQFEKIPLLQKEAPHQLAVILFPLNPPQPLTTTIFCLYGFVYYRDFI